MEDKGIFCLHKAADSADGCSSEPPHVSSNQEPSAKAVSARCSDLCIFGYLSLSAYNSISKLLSSVSFNREVRNNETSTENTWLKKKLRTETGSVLGVLIQLKIFYVYAYTHTHTHWL